MWTVISEPLVVVQRWTTMNMNIQMFHIQFNGHFPSRTGMKGACVQYATGQNVTGHWLLIGCWPTKCASFW